MAQQGDQGAEEYLIRKFKAEVRGKARAYFIVGADGEDIVQEGMIGLFKAIRSYDAGKHASFRTFAALCVSRQILTAIKMAARQKHAPLNQSISLSGTMTAESPGKTIGEALPSGQDTDPEALYILKEDIHELRRHSAAAFSDMEWRIWCAYLQGQSRGEIARAVGKTPKAVDNAIQRAKKKMQAHLAGGK